MMKSGRLFASVWESLSIPAAALAALFAVYFAFGNFWLAVKLLSILFLCLMSWASWTGYRQNRGRNDEWPVNLLVLGASISGGVVLIASIVR